MVRMVEAKQGSRKGGRGRGLAGLARLRHECHRFREEVVCIRSFPRLQLRWPSLARLEIGSESSEEDDMVWDAAEGQTSDTLSICWKTKGVGDVYVELPSPNLAPSLVSSKAEESAFGKKSGGTKQDCRSREDVEISRKSGDIVENSQECEDVASDGMCWTAGNHDDVVEDRGVGDQTLAFKLAEQMSEPLTAAKDTADFGQDASFMDPECLHTNSGARTAATALFTANPHHNSDEVSTECNLHSNCRCQSEGFKLVCFPGFNVSDNATHKEREVNCEQVLCSSFESRTCSPSELTGYPTLDERYQHSTPVQTDSLEDGGTVCNVSSIGLQAYTGKYLLGSLPPEASLNSDIGYVREEVQSGPKLKGPAFSSASVQSPHLGAGQSQSWVLDRMKQTSLRALTAGCVENHMLPAPSISDSLRTAKDVTQSNTQHQDWVVEQGKQKYPVRLTKDSVDGRMLPISFLSDLEEKSFLSISSSLQKDATVVFPTESEPNSGPVMKQVRSSGLITLSGMENFARLGVGSTRDSTVAAVVATRIKHALEGLGDNRNQEQEHRKSSDSRHTERRIGARFGLSSEGQKDALDVSGAATNSIVDRSDLRRFKNLGGLLCENSENRMLESHFFIHRERNKKMSRSGQPSVKTRMETGMLLPSHHAECATPEEPDLYLQHVIAALDSGRKQVVEEPSLDTPTSLIGSVVNEESPTLQQDVGMSRNLSVAHAGGPSITSRGEMCKCHSGGEGVADHRIQNSRSDVLADTVLEGQKPGNENDSTQELNLSRYHNCQKAGAQASLEDRRRFSVEITAPTGSFVEVEVGGQPTVFEQQEEVIDQAVDNPLNCNPSSLCSQQRPSVQVDHAISNVFQQRSLLGAASTHQERPFGPAPLFLSTISAIKDSKAKEGRHTEQAMPCQSKLLPSMVSEVDLPLRPFPRTVKCSTQEELLHSFDKKIAELAKKANQLKEEEMLPETSPYKLQGSGLHKSQLEVTAPERQPGLMSKTKASEVFHSGSSAYEGQGHTESVTRTGRRTDGEDEAGSLVNEKKQLGKKPSILKSATKARSVGSESLDSSIQSESQAAQTAEKLQAFGDAADGLAHELKVLMKARGHELNLECQAPRKRKVVWAYPEAQELGPTIKPQYTSSGKQTGSIKYPQLPQSSSAHSKHAGLEVIHSAMQGTSHVPKTKEQYKSPSSRQPRAPKRPPPQRLSVNKYSGLEDAKASLSLSVEEFGKKQVSPESSHWSEQSRAQQERGLIKARKIPDDSTDETFDYNDFRQELKELQAEREKLESLVNTILKTDTDPLEQKYHPLAFSSQDGKVGDPKITPECGMTSGDPRVWDDNKRHRSAISPLTESPKVIQSDSERHSFSEEPSLIPGHHLHMTLDSGDDDVLSSIDLPKSSQLPTNQSSNRQDDQGGPSSVSLVNSQDNRNIKEMMHKNIVQLKSMRKHIHTQTSSMSLKGTSGVLRRKTKSQHAARAIRQHKSLEPTDANVKTDKIVNVMCDATPGHKAMVESHPPVDRQQKLKVGSAVVQTKAMEVSTSTSIRSGDVLLSDQQDVKDGPDHYQKSSSIPLAGSSTQLREQGAGDLKDIRDVELHGTSVSDMQDSAKLACSLRENAPRGAFSSFKGELAVVEETIASKVPGWATSELQLQAKSEACKESQNDHEYGDGACGQKPEGSLDAPKRDVPLEENLETGKCPVEDSKTEGGYPALDHSQEYEATSLEKGTSCSGSLKSVLEAYREAQSSAAFMLSSLSSSPEVQKRKEKAPLPSRYEHTEKLSDAEKERLTVETTLKQKEKFTPLGLLEQAEKAEAKELKLRRAHKEYVKCKQKLARNKELSRGNDKLQGGLTKKYSRWEERKVPKLTYRTAQFDVKRREDWNDSTVLSQDRQWTGQNTNAKEVAQALIAKVLNDEFLRQQRGHKMNILQPIKALDTEIRRKRRDPVDLETYASTLALMKVKEKATFTKKTAPREGERDINGMQQTGDDVAVEQFTTPINLRRKTQERIDYFSMGRGELKTENRMLDKCTISFKEAREHSVGHTSGSGDYLMDRGVRESIEHWLDTSGGFEYLDAFYNIGEEDIFNKPLLTSSIQRKANFSMTAGVSERDLSEKACLGQLSSPSVEMEVRREGAGIIVLKTSETPSHGDLVGASSIGDRLALQSSLREHEEFVPQVGTVNKVPATNGSSRHPSLEMDRASDSGAIAISKASDQFVREYSSLEPGQVDSIDDKLQLLYRKDISREERNTCSSQSKHLDTKSPDLGASQADKKSQVLSQDFEEKLTEDEELELALLEIVLHTLLRDDPVLETAEKLTRGTSPVQTEGRPIEFSGKSSLACPSTLPSPPVSTRQQTSMLIDDRRISRDVQDLVPNFPLLDFASEEHARSSVKSSDGEWPEYKCLAEMQRGLESCEEEDWPEYSGVGEQETVADLDQGAQMEEVPSEQISTPATGELDPDEKLPGGPVLPQPVTVSTRPPYSAVHSMRAAERQRIDFPGIASLAFGYPRPRPPPLKQNGQTSVDRSSVRVQTANLTSTQTPAPGTSFFLLPLYGLTDGRPLLPPYSLYTPPFPASEGPSQAGGTPVTAPGQHSPQFISSQYAPTPRGAVPVFPPPLVSPPSGAASDGLYQPSTLPVAAVVQHSLQIPAPSTAAEHGTATTENPTFQPPSLHHPHSEGPSQHSTVCVASSATATPVKLTPTSGKVTSSDVRKVFVHVTEHEKLTSLPIESMGSFSSSPSCCSSATTPSTFLSSPEHDARVASALAQSLRSVQGVVRSIFQDASSDEAEADTGELLFKSKQDRGVQTEDQGALQPPNLMNTKDVEDLPIDSFVAENSCTQSRVEIAQAVPSFPVHPTTSSLGNKPDSGTSMSVATVRSNVLMASYDGSSSSEGSGKRMRGTAHEQFSGQSSLEEAGQFERMSSKSAGQVARTRTSSQSSGEIVGPTKLSLRRPGGNQANLKRHFTSYIFSEGEVEPGEMPSEGECRHTYPNAWDSHQSSMLDSFTYGQDDVSEPGEISRRAAEQLQLPRSRNCRGQGSNQSLSKGELKAGELREPGEVRSRKESTEL